MVLVTQKNNVSRTLTGWYLVGDKKIHVRSGWELVYARSLEWLKQKGSIKDWYYEPKTFWFDGVRRGVVSYLPDFLIINNDGTEEYHEVKGYMDARSATKLKRMAKYYPEVKMVLVDKDAYRSVVKWNSLYPQATKTVK